MSSVLARVDESRLYVSTDGGATWHPWDGTVAAAGADGALLDGVSATIRASVLDLANSNPLTVAITDGAGTQITSFGGGTQYTEDAASVADPIGGQLIARRRDSLAVETSTDGDVTALNATGKGELYVKQSDVVAITAASLPLPSGASTSAKQPALGTAGTAAADVLTIQGIASMTKLLVTPDSVALPANQSVNVAQFGGTAVVTGVGAAGSGVPRVTESRDNIESTAAAGSSAATSYTVALAGFSGAGAQLKTTAWSGTFTVEYSEDNQTSWSGAVCVVNGAQYHFGLLGVITRTTSTATEDLHLVAGEGWTHVRLRLATSTAGTYAADMRATMLISPLAVGALTACSAGSSSSYWVNQVGGRATTAGFPAAVTTGTSAHGLFDVYGRQTIKKLDNWTALHNPAAATKATISRAAAGAGIKNVCTSISISLWSGGTATTSSFELIDGATGGATKLWTCKLGSQTAAGTGSVITISDLWIEGTANTQMTLEATAVGAAGSFQTVSMTGTITQ